MPVTQRTNLTGAPRGSTVKGLLQAPHLQSFRMKKVQLRLIVGKIKFAREMSRHIFVVNGEDCNKEQWRHLIAYQRTNENQDPRQALEKVLSCVNKEYHALKIETQIEEVGWNLRETGPMRLFIVDFTSQTGLHSNFEKDFCITHSCFIQ